jgi:DNA-directed RNA polymerase subunit RPC12/RpoP
LHRFATFGATVQNDTVLPRGHLQTSAQTGARMSRSPANYDRESIGKDGFQPLCPRCNTKMRLDHSYPVLLTDSVDQLVYLCARCGTENIRTVIRPIR